ncbi:MAG: hypothetical protein NVS2B5_19360 [Beijerinckiaceae bacterium]
MRRGADIHAGIVQHEVFEMDEMAGPPQRRDGIVKVPARQKPVPDGRVFQALVKPGQGIGGSLKWSGDLLPGRRLGKGMRQSAIGNRQGSG